MAQSVQASLSEALDFPISDRQECLIQLPAGVCFGSVSCGGMTACAIAKYAMLYAAEHPQMQQQTSMRSAHVQYYRPTFPRKGPIKMTMQDINIGRAWSTLRVEVFQPNSSSRIAASADIIMSDLSIPGVALSSPWCLSPSAPPVDLARLESNNDHNWTCYHTSFKPDGFRRTHAYVKHFIPRTVQSPVRYVEQWIAPGWDCTPYGSINGTQAKWTTEMIQFAADQGLPLEQNWVSPRPGDKYPTASVAATLKYAAAQQRARDEQIPNWRDLQVDGSGDFPGKVIFFTITMSTEIKKELPPEGARWLYLRTEAKSVENGRMDLEALLFDESMSLIAISHQVGQIVPTENKQARRSRL